LVEDLLDFLGSTEIFATLERPVLQDLLGYLQAAHVPAGTTVMNRGEPAESLFLVRFGRLQVYAPTPAGDAVLGEVGPGEVVGEVALLLGEPRSASVRAIRDSLVLRLSSQDFERFVEAHPDAVLRLLRDLTRRLVGHSPKRRPGDSGPARTVAVVPAGASGLPPDFRAELVPALARLGSTLWITTDIVARELGGGASEVEDPGNSAVLGWLHRMEEQHRYVLYEAGVTPSAWSSLCLRQADQILLVGEAGSDPRPNHVEEVLLGGAGGPSARRELVLVHPGADRPRNTATWLTGREVSAHHHLRRGRRGDYERLARFIAGRAVGLVLGGGGARGAAHLGALKAIEDVGLPVDVVGGTSIGAPMAAAYALEWDHATRVAAMRDVGRLGTLLQPTLPLVSLSSARRLGKLMHGKLLGDLRIEDSWIPFFCISSNLSRAEIVVHEQGELWRALRASISIPGLLPPVFHDGDLLVDGGTLNNLPVDVMRRRVDTGTVIAVDLRIDVDLCVAQSFDPSMSGWRVLARRLRNLRPGEIPDLVTLLIRASELGSARGERDTLAGAAVDIHLRPPVSDCGFLDFKAASRLADASYRYTIEHLHQVLSGPAGEPLSQLIQPKPAER
jgi:predicted acylesterase/phospholipase RssA